MKVLAIGATGFIGPHIVRMLVGWGHEVAVLHRGRTGAELPQAARHAFANRDRLEDIRAELDRFAPEAVLDVIPYTERQAREIVAACRARTGRVVALSSADVYRNYDGLRGKTMVPPDPVPLAEDAPLRETRYPYRDHNLAFEHARDYEKILVEQVLLDEPELPATVLRLPAVYGPGDAQHRIRPYLRRMVDDRPAILLEERQASWRWTRGFVTNVAAAVALAVTEPRRAHGVYNVGDEPTLTEREWVERVGAAAGWQGRVVAVPASELPQPLAQPFDWRYDLWTDTTRICRELGYLEPVPLGEALLQTVDWERPQLDGAEPVDYSVEDAVLESRRAHDPT